MAAAEREEQWSRQGRQISAALINTTTKSKKRGKEGLSDLQVVRETRCHGLALPTMGWALSINNQENASIVVPIGPSSGGHLSAEISSSQVGSGLHSQEAGSTSPIG